MRVESNLSVAMGANWTSTTFTISQIRNPGLVEHHPLQNDVRRARRERRLGPGAACLLCGEHAPEALIEHHILGKAKDKHLIGSLCKNCHAKIHEAQRTAPAHLSTRLRARGRALCEWADLLRDVYDA